MPSVKSKRDSRKSGGGFLRHTSDRQNIKLQVKKTNNEKWNLEPRESPQKMKHKWMRNIFKTWST